MKRIKAINGYTIYQATTQRDADNYNCEVGEYNIYLSSDIRDFGLSCSYPEWDGVDSLAVAVAMCKGSSYAVAVELAEELSDSTIQDMDLVLEIERRLAAGESLDSVRDSYDTEEQCFTSDCLGDRPAEPDNESVDLDLAYDEAALRDWELSAIEIGDYLISGEHIVRVVSIDHSTGEYRFTAQDPWGGYVCVDAESADKCNAVGNGSDWADKRRASELWTDHAIASRATYYVVEIDGTAVTVAPSFSQNFYESRETLERRKRYAFFRTLAERYAFSDCSDDRILEAVYDGVPVEYAGWQPGMTIEFRDPSTNLTVFSESFPEWDH